jgi:hypothetical protein
LDIVFDIELVRPGCVLLQAAFLCDPRIAHAFPTRSWIVYPTPGLKKYHIDDQQQLDLLVAKVEQRMNDEAQARVDADRP